MNVGDRVQIDGHAGAVVAIIHEGKFHPDYPADQWAYLERGLLVEDDTAGLIHYADLASHDVRAASPDDEP